MKTGLCLPVFLVGLVVWAAGCASEPELMVPEPGSLIVVHGASGKETTLAAVVEAASGADVLILGETHGDRAGLGWQERVWEEVAARHELAALSLESASREQQLGFDTVFNPIEEESFGVSVHVVVVFSQVFALADDPLHFGVTHRLIAANAPRRYVKAYREEGQAAIERMTPEQRRLIVIPEEPIEGRYRRDFDRAMMRMGSAHGGEGAGLSDEALDAFYRAQLVWDATMADSVAKALREGHRPVVHVVGRFHSDFDGGLVQYLRRYAPGVEVVTVSLVDAVAPAAGLREQDRGRADFVVYLEPREPGLRSAPDRLGGGGD